MSSNSKLQFFLLLATIAYILRLVLANNFSQFTVLNDINSFHSWGINLAENGPRNFYSGWSDYLPGYLYVLWLLALLEKWLITHLLLQWEILFKLPSILSDIGSGLFIFLIAKKFTTQKRALTTSIVFLFNPAFFANSTLWGQADSIITFFLLSSFYYLLEGKYIFSALTLSLAQVIKPIAILSLPFYLIFLFKNKVSKLRIFSFLTLIGFVVVLAFIPFNNSDNLFRFILERHSITSNQYPYTSVNAFNFWAITTRLWEPDTFTFLNISFHNWGNLLFLSFYLFLIGLYLTIKSTTNNVPKLLTMLLALIYLGMFIFLTRMHERHLYYGLTYLSLILSNLNFFGIFLVVILYLVHLVNLYYPYSQATLKPLILSQNEIVYLSVINVTVFAYFVGLLILRYYKNK